MNAELKARWIKNLRNGRYQQGSRYLCKNEQYCCLGVLAEIYRPGFLTSAFGFDAKGIKDAEGSIHTHMLPDEALQTLDLNYSVKLTSEDRLQIKPYMYLLDEVEHATLMYMNDCGVPFAVIADILERHTEI